MDRIIGIDFGKARTGLAVSDPLGIFASALDTLPSAKIIEYLQKYTEKESIKAFVLGWPLNLDGSMAQSGPGVEGFMQRLHHAFPDIPIFKEDERFTSVLAHRVMIDSGMKAKDRREKENVDKISAAIILQSYLDRQNGGSSTPFEVPDSLSRNVTKNKRRK